MNDAERRAGAVRMHCPATAGGVIRHEIRDHVAVKRASLDLYKHRRLAMHALHRRRALHPHDRLMLAAPGTDGSQLKPV